MKKVTATIILLASILLIGCTTSSSNESNENAKPIEMKQEIDPNSLEGFKASRPWILEDAQVIKDPDYKSSDVYSSKYMIQDNLDVPIDLNPDYLGEWKAYGMIDKVDLPANQINSQNLFEVFQRKGDILSGNEKDSSWRGIRFLDDGSVETDSGLHQGFIQYDFWGTRWTDGWIISDTEMARSHSIIYNGDEALLFFELKNGDYSRGSAPTYMVFIKQ